MQTQEYILIDTHAPTHNYTHTHTHIHTHTHTHTHTQTNAFEYTLSKRGLLMYSHKLRLKHSDFLEEDILQTINW